MSDPKLKVMQPLPKDPSPGVSLGQLLDIQDKHIRESLQKHLQGNVDEHVAQDQLHAATLDVLAQEAAEAVCEKLRLDVFSLAFQAWAAVRELEEYADAAKHPAGEVNVVRWGKCSIKAPQEVDVKLTVAGVQLTALRLRVDLRADFHSLALTIRDGTIRKVTPGPAKVSAGLSCGNAIVVPERSTPELSFPVGVSFDPGLPLRWTGRAQETVATP